jgi:coenzyme F420-0:L-glutamate ligase/coenzyme F420-1:gamma-L-glutamate ligase
MPDRIEILPVTGIGEITPGTDLAAVIQQAAPWLRDLDVLVVTSKIVSKSEGQLVDVARTGPERDNARDHILTAETARVVARRGDTRIVQTHHGFVMAAAGIDASNVDPSQLVLLPKDPDASARALRASLLDRYGLDVAVIVSDTMGRPWRLGLTDVALGAAGLPSIVDYRGETDPYGNEMHLTQMATVDELSSAAELVKGKFNRVPVAVVRGFLTRTSDHDPGARSLVRDATLDLFSMGTAEARSAGLAEAAALTDASSFAPAPDDGAAVLARVLASLPRSPACRFAVRAPSTDAPAFTQAVISATVADPADPGQLVAMGTDVHRLRCALAAAGLSAISAPSPDAAVHLFVGAILAR